MGRFDLSDSEWEVIEPLLPKGTCGPIRKVADDRRIFNAIFYILRTGAPWADLPERYGSHKTTYIGITAGPSAAYEVKYSKPLPPHARTACCLSTVRLSKPTEPVRVPVKKGPIGHTYRLLTRRPVE